MKLRRFCHMAVICALALCCLSMNAGAIDVEAREADTAIVRATNRFSANIPANTLDTTDVNFSLEVGETITISATYTPKSASVDFGFIAPDGYFYSVNVQNGKIDKTIKVDQRGDYMLAIKNNSSNTVSVSGYVIY